MAELEPDPSSPDFSCVLLCIERKMMILLLLLMTAATVLGAFLLDPPNNSRRRFMPISQVRKLIHIYVYICINLIHINSLSTYICIRENIHIYVREN